MELRPWEAPPERRRAIQRVYRNVHRPRCREYQLERAERGRKGNGFPFPISPRFPAKRWKGRPPSLELREWEVRRAREEELPPDPPIGLVRRIDRRRCGLGFGRPLHSEPARSFAPTRRGRLRLRRRSRNAANERRGSRDPGQMPKLSRRDPSRSMPASMQKNLSPQRKRIVREGTGGAVLGLLDGATRDAATGTRGQISRKQSGLYSFRPPLNVERCPPNGLRQAGKGDAGSIPFHFSQSSIGHRGKRNR